MSGTPYNPLRAPLDRRDLDRVAPWLRAGLGLTLLAWSSYATIIGFNNDLSPVLDGKMLFSIPAGVLAGILLAVLLSLGEWLTSERARIVYSALLLVDAWYTQRQVGPAAEKLARAHLADAGIAPIVALVLSWLAALASARYGEILLFGRRR
jgi:hypothetical protein